MRSEFRRVLSLAIVVCCALAALSVFGCGKSKEKVDPYAYASLDQVTRGFVQSKDFLFEIDAPKFEFVYGNTGIIRSGNHLEILVADDLENRAPQLAGKRIGVQKCFSPYVWLLAKHVKDGLNVTELDSVATPVLPRFTEVKLDEVQGFDIGKLSWTAKDQRMLEEMLDTEVQTVGTLSYLPDHQAEVVSGDVAGEPLMAWYLSSENGAAKFKVANVTPSLELTFRLLEAEGLPFVGGVKIGAAYTVKERNKSKISAPIDVQWLRYANRYLAP